MTWLRQRSRGVAALALFAMALQIFCTFGHVHLTDGSSHLATVQSVALAKAQTADATAIVAAHGATAPLPAGDGDPPCPLCLVGSLVGAAAVPPLPALPLPIVYASFDPPRSITTSRSFDILTSFWSRGPPTS